MIELIEIDRKFEPIKFDPKLYIDVAQITGGIVKRANVQLNRCIDTRLDNPKISLPTTLFPNDYQVVSTKPIVHNYSLQSNNYLNYLFYQQQKDKLNDVAAARQGDKRVKYGVLTLKPYNNQMEYSLPIMIEDPKRFDQKFPCNMRSNLIDTLPIEIIDTCCPPSDEISKIVGIIYDVKDNNDQFAKVQVTKACRNTPLRAKNIDIVLNYLSDVLGCLKHVEVIRPATGRPPSTKYQILWGKTEYFPERNKEEVRDVGSQNKVQ
ncbi:hypothetical protein [uncultured Desulfobulbus sp.]|uniref:hypothetical protein n=1 Tax=uncultured Desulfobulbus sp. TaxID=239745 RepID=UPI0029C89B77|nr:hypothetical protein [uncultured Desulfobulbus sp.]